MARKTKEDAQATRALILDTAERVFERGGVLRTSLQEIAQEAGLTRGAIYWHFENKIDLFNAMMERVTLPLMAQLDAQVGELTDQPLSQIRSNTALALHQTVHDAQVRRVFGIASHKVEYVSELQGLRERHITERDACLADMQSLLLHAKQLGQLRPGLDLRGVAYGLHAVVSGMMHNWLLSPDAFDLEALGLAALDVYLAGISAASVN